MKIIFETERLLLAEFTEEDAPLLFDLNKDDEVRKYVHEASPTLASSQTALNEIILPQYHLYHYGRWAVYIKGTNEFIGWCGLKFLKDTNEIDLGYRFKKIFWGKGYATEAAGATIKYGFEKLHLKKIVARAHVENTASINVIEKCRMLFLREEIYHNDKVSTYELSAEDHS